VCSKLTAEEVKSRKARRSDDFRSDPAIPGGSATVDDYKNSAYDRGHLAPAADMSFSLQAMSESFYMSNMSPQRSEVNRGLWKDLEEKVRDYALANGALYVVSGPIFDPNRPCITIGKNKVAVPDKYYKVLLDPNSKAPKAIGFIMNNSSSNPSLADCAVSVDAVEAATGLDFFNQLDPADEARLESSCNFQQWEQSLPPKKRSKKK
jgi:endonuclease G